MEINLFIWMIHYEIWRELVFSCHHSKIHIKFNKVIMMLELWSIIIDILFVIIIPLITLNLLIPHHILLFLFLQLCLLLIITIIITLFLLLLFFLLFLILLYLLPQPNPNNLSPLANSINFLIWLFMIGFILILWDSTICTLLWYSLINIMFFILYIIHLILFSSLIYSMIPILLT